MRKDTTKTDLNLCSVQFNNTIDSDVRDLEEINKDLVQGISGLVSIMCNILDSQKEDMYNNFYTSLYDTTLIDLSYKWLICNLEPDESQFDPFKINKRDHSIIINKESISSLNNTKKCKEIFNNINTFKLKLINDNIDKSITAQLDIKYIPLECLLYALSKSTGSKYYSTYLSINGSTEVSISDIIQYLIMSYNPNVNLKELIKNQWNS